MSSTISSDLARSLKKCFIVLILDNEVTVENFVQETPLLWGRLVENRGSYEMAEGYPCLLDFEQAEREKLNWDCVSIPGIVNVLETLEPSVGYVAFGNNAGQGLPLALTLPIEWRSEKAAILYGSSLPEKEAYRERGYRVFCPRADLISRVNSLAKAADKPLALAFINTIQHNEKNYHVPWPSR